MMISQLYDLFSAAGKLKRIKRAGWLKLSIDSPESVADHCFGTAFMAMVMGDILGLDTNKIMRMALLHDLAESEVGDITPDMGISKKKKHELEKKALDKLLAEIENGGYYMQLWQEYEEGKTYEASLLKDIDKLDMAMQAVEYKKVMPQVNINEFIVNAKQNINHELPGKLLEKIIGPKDTP